MNAEITIRIARPDDAESIAAIHVASWQSTYRGVLDDAYLDSLSADQRTPMWRTLLTTASTTTVLVALRDNHMVGFCSFGPASDDERESTGELHTIYLSPDCQRQGIGGALLRRAESAMAAHGWITGTLWVHRDNPGARAFYAAHGWAADGTERRDELWGQTVIEARYTKALAGSAGAVGSG